MPGGVLGWEGPWGSVYCAPTSHLLREGPSNVTKPKAFAPHVLPKGLGATWRLCLVNGPLSPASVVCGTCWAEWGLREAERASRRGLTMSRHVKEQRGKSLAAVLAKGVPEAGGGADTPAQSLILRRQ